jgi:hypothetical protein
MLFWKSQQSHCWINNPHLDSATPIDSIINRTSKEVNEHDCITYSNHEYPSSIIVDLGHRFIRIYILHKHEVIDSTYLNLGGGTISRFFVSLVKENNFYEQYSGIYQLLLFF